MDESIRRTKRRTRVVWIAAIALGSIGFVAGAYTVFDILASPPVPDLATAPADEVATYLGDPRGWCGLSRPERKQWLLDLAQARSAGPARDELAEAFRRMSKTEKEVFVDGFLEVVKPELLADARAFRKVPVRQRNDFLRDKLTDYDAMSMSLRGGGSANLTKAFGSTLPGGKSNWSSVLMEKTTVQERAEIMPYVGQLIAFGKRLKTQAQSTSQPSQP